MQQGQTLVHRSRGSARGVERSVHRDDDLLCRRAVPEKRHFLRSWDDGNDMVVLRERRALGLALCRPTTDGVKRKERGFDLTPAKPAVLVYVVDTQLQF